MGAVFEEIKALKDISNKPVLIFGTSGISKEVCAVIEQINEYYERTVYDVLGFVAESEQEVGKSLSGGAIVCSDGGFESFISKYDDIGVVIPLGTPDIKRKIFERINKFENVSFPNIISPYSNIMSKSNVEIGIGNIICSGVVMTVDIHIGNFNLFNLNTTVGHDVVIGDFCVVNPLTAISGCTVVNDSVLVGAGSSIKEHSIVDSNSIIGMGAIVCKNVEKKTVVISDAARVLKRL